MSVLVAALTMSAQDEVLQKYSDMGDMNTTVVTKRMLKNLPLEQFNLPYLSDLIDRIDNMKILASLKKPDERSKAQDAIKNGKSPDSVIAMMKKKAETADPRQKLEKERARLTKTISELTTRLEYVEESLAQL